MLLLNDIAPVKSGTAFIIDADTASNYNGNISIDDNFLAGYPKQPAWKQIANNYESRHVFKNNIVELDHDPTQEEYQKIAYKTIKQFANEMYEIGKNQPIFLRAALSKTVVNVIDYDVEVMAQVNGFYNFPESRRVFCNRLNLGNTLGVAATLAPIAGKTGNIDGKFYVIPSIAFRFTTYTFNN